MAVQTYVKRGNEYTAGLTFSGVDADDEEVFVSLIHEWGNVVVEDTLATRNATNDYEYTFSIDDTVSSGVHKIKWTYLQTAVAKTTINHINVYQQYIDPATFFTNHEDLEDDFEDFFADNERKVRDIINTFCGQAFDSYQNKSQVFDGSGTNKLYTATRIEELITVTLLPDSDITDIVEIDNRSDFYLRLTGTTAITPPTVTGAAPNWGNEAQFEVLGNWGWSYVPNNITEATDILLADRFNDDVDFIKHGAIEAYMDTHRIRFDSTMLGTTGNIDADNLLMDYTLFVLGII